MGMITELQCSKGFG